MSGRGTVVGWLLGMLFVPPLAAFLIGMAGSWTSGGMMAALVIYALLMIGMGISAAFATSKGGARVGFSLLFIVGMLFAQCAVFFVGCSILVAVS